MRIIIIGAVAAGTSAACKARRNTEDAEIVIYEKDTDISYSICGIPYYIGEDYIERDDLTPRDPLWFKKRFNIDIFTGYEVLKIDREEKLVTVRNNLTGDVKNDSYDKLIIASGAKPFLPKINGIENGNVFAVRNIQSADSIKKFIASECPKKAVIIGGGFIGLEMAESLMKNNIETTIIEEYEHILPSMDREMACILEKRIEDKGVKILTNQRVIEISDAGRKVITDSSSLDTDMIIISAGVKPETKLALEAGIKLGKHSGIIVDDKMRTNDDDIYACGDCCEMKSPITKEFIYRPMGSTANKMGRIAGDAVTGGNLEFRGILGTGIFKFFDVSCGFTGMSEKEARACGFDVEVIHNIKEFKSSYLNDSGEIIIKGIADRKTQRLLGAEIIGSEGVDKRLDVFAAAISFNASAGDLFHLDLAYAPPFSTTKDPVAYTGMILDNALNNNRKIITYEELIKNRESYLVIDVRATKDYEKGHIDGAVNMPLGKLRTDFHQFNVNDRIVVHCNKGVTGNAAHNFMLNKGFKNVYNLSGGYKSSSFIKGNIGK